MRGPLPSSAACWFMGGQATVNTRGQRARDAEPDLVHAGTWLRAQSEQEGQEEIE